MSERLLTRYSYGPKGYKVICATFTDWFEAIPPNLFHPLPPERFLEFILIPNIACQLIADDRGTDPQSAHQDLIHSGDVGDALQQDDNVDNDANMNSVVEAIPGFVLVDSTGRRILVCSIFSRNQENVQNMSIDTDLEDKQ